MAKVFTHKNKELIIFNEDELEIGNLYCSTLPFGAISLYNEIPKIREKQKYRKEGTFIEIENDQIRSLDDFNTFPLMPHEPFMVLEKEKNFRL